jgi:hypothetical protein
MVSINIAVDKMTAATPHNHTIGDDFFLPDFMLSISVLRLTATKLA